MGKNIDKNISKKISKRTTQKIADATGDLIDNKNVNIIRKSQKRCNRIIHKQLQMSMIKIYLQKDIYLQEKNKKLLMI